MKFNLIYMDPPWQYNNRRITRRDGGKSRFGIGAAGRYPVLGMEELYKLPIFNIAAENCAMHIWSTGPFTPECFKMVEYWNKDQRRPFRFINKAFNWIKKTKNNKIFFGPGHYYHSGNEDCWLFIRGKMDIIAKNIRQEIEATHPRNENKKIIHSRKPVEARERIVELFGNLPRIELFATEKLMDGWITTGYGVDGIDIREFLLNSDEYLGNLTNC